MFCIYCNHILTNGEQTCPSCGKPVGKPVRIEVFREGKGRIIEAGSLSELALPEQNPAGPKLREPELSEQRMPEPKLREPELSGHRKPEFSEQMREEKTVLNNSLQDRAGKDSAERKSGTSGVIPAVIAAVVSILAIGCVAAGLNSRIRQADIAGREAAKELIDAQDARISDLEGQAGELEEKIQSLEELLANQNETISSLTEELSASAEANQRLEERLEELENARADEQKAEQKENEESSPDKKE